MIRRIHCSKCGKGCFHPPHPEDTANGFKTRFVELIAKKPASHFIEVLAGAEKTRTELTSLICDGCGEPIADGAAVTAITQYRGQEPGNWEQEFGQIKI
jgi:hypothetical protein